jgi:hypothetical protein
MPRKVTLTFTGTLSVLRALERVLSANRTSYEIAIERTTKKPFIREVAFVERVRVRPTRQFKEPELAE